VKPRETGLWVTCARFSPAGNLPKIRLCGHHRFRALLAKSINTATSQTIAASNQELLCSVYATLEG
jgi:hypothetical protein